MAQQIVRLSVHQTAKVFGVLYTLIGLLVIPIVFVTTLSGPETERMNIALLLLLPLAYGALGYIGVAIGCVAYNAVASRIGGIEFTLGAGESTSP